MIKLKLKLRSVVNTNVRRTHVHHKNSTGVDDVVSMGTLGGSTSPFGAFPCSLPKATSLSYDATQVLIHNMSIKYLPRLNNGNLGLYTNASTPNSILTTLSKKSALLNPVLGMRFDQADSRRT
jgi:hypothetical protein